MDFPNLPIFPLHNNYCDIQCSVSLATYGTQTESLWAIQMDHTMLTRIIINSLLGGFKLYSSV